MTTLDLTLQRFAENAVAGGLDQLESRYPKLRRSDPRARLQAALVALDPATGEIRAFVGGRDYQVSQFDRVTLARRQPGSAFKPFVYLAAIRPRERGALPFTAATMVEDAPITVNVDGKPWSPRNYEDRYEGRVSVRRALEQSLNGATVRIAQVVGAPAIAETAKACSASLQKAAPIPSLALGALEVDADRPRRRLSSRSRMAACARARSARCARSTRPTAVPRRSRTTPRRPPSSPPPRPI